MNASDLIHSRAGYPFPIPNPILTVGFHNVTLQVQWPCPQKILRSPSLLGYESSGPCLPLPVPSPRPNVIPHLHVPRRCHRAAQGLCLAWISQVFLSHYESCFLAVRTMPKVSGTLLGLPSPRESHHPAVHTCASPNSTQARDGAWNSARPPLPMESHHPPPPPVYEFLLLSPFLSLSLS